MLAGHSVTYWSVHQIIPGIMPVTRQQSIHLRNSKRMMRGRKSARGRPEPTESAKDRCVWTEGDETALIDYITANRSKGGDGMNFDKVFWAAAATEMAKHNCSGPTKTANACRSKWTRVCCATISPLIRPSLLTDELLAPKLLWCSRSSGKCFWNDLQHGTWS